MKYILLLVGMELKLFIRETVNLIYIIVLPIFFLFLLGFIFNNPNFTSKTGIIDQDITSASKDLIDLISTYSYFDYKIIASDDRQPADAFSNFDIGFVIPSGFEDSIEHNEILDLDVYINATDQQKATTDSSMVVALMSDVNLNLLSYESKIFANYRFKNKAFNSYVEFLLPGLFIMIIMSLGMFNIGLKLTIYREFNQIKILYVLPIRKIHFLIVQIILNLIIVIIQIVILIIIAVLIFKVHLPANWLLFTGGLLLTMIMFLSVGFMISSFFKKYVSAMSFINMLYLPLLFLSGIYFSRDMIPGIFKYLMYLSPAYYGVDFVRSVYLGAYNVNSLLVDTSAMLAVTIIAIIISQKRFKWSV